MHSVTLRTNSPSLRAAVLGLIDEVHLIDLELSLGWRAVFDQDRFFAGHGDTGVIEICCAAESRERDLANFSALDPEIERRNVELGPLPDFRQRPHGQQVARAVSAPGRARRVGHRAPIGARTLSPISRL